MIPDEIDDPVITVQRSESEHQALRCADDLRYGLAASVSTMGHWGLWQCRGLDFGAVWINTHIPFVAETPRGGVEHSGPGRS